MKTIRFHSSGVKHCLTGDTNRRGLTLIEIVVALAIFIVILGTTAQSLIYSYTALAVHQQRTSAGSDCLAVMAAMRRLAYHAEATESCSQDEPLFPCVLLEWVEQFPESFEVATQDSALFDTYGQFFSLPGQTFEIILADAAGNPAVSRPILSQNTNPVYVTATTSWTGMRGRGYVVSMTTVLTDR